MEPSFILQLRLPLSRGRSRNTPGLSDVIWPVRLIASEAALVDQSLCLSAASFVHLCLTFGHFAFPDHDEDDCNEHEEAED